MKYEVLIMDDELHEYTVEVEVDTTNTVGSADWWEDDLGPAVKAVGHDPDWVEDFWVAGQDEEE